MSFIRTADGTNIFYKDWSAGRPILFSHGWPLSGDAWDAQMLFLAGRGYRATARARGFGPALAGQRHGHLCRRSCRADRSARSARPRDGRPFHRRRRARAVHWTARHLPRCQGRAGWGRTAADALHASRSGRHADGGVRWKSGRASPPIVRNSITTSPPPFTASTAMGRKTASACATASGAKECKGESAANTKAFGSSRKSTIRQTWRRSTFRPSSSTATTTRSSRSAPPLEKAVDLVPGATLKIYPGGSHGLAQVQVAEFSADLLGFIELVR
jgi:non-heme chloroperoxidase